jgi:acyl-CoA reductase-like NAD-dependent aldehyde dehydrogenase
MANVSSFRIDHMPCGGVRPSGFGRQGIRHTIEEGMEMRQLTYNPRLA